MAFEVKPVKPKVALVVVAFPAVSEDVVPLGIVNWLVNCFYYVRCDYRDCRSLMSF